MSAIEAQLIKILKLVSEDERNRNQFLAKQTLRLLTAVRILKESSK